MAGPKEYIFVESRVSQAPRILPATWELYKEKIQTLYEDLTLDQVRGEMNKQYGFWAS
jgi:hypothetical protein